MAHLDTDGGGEAVFLVAAGLQQGEPHLYLGPVLRSARLASVAGAGDVSGLARSQVE